MDKHVIVKKVIDEWDPIDLLAIGCPDDEYDPEIRDIVQLLSNVKSIDELAAGIQSVFLHWFDQEINLEACYPVAIRIWNKLE